MSHRSGEVQPLRQKDASSPALLGPEAPLPMPEQDFAAGVVACVSRRRPGGWAPRAAVFAGALLLTAAFAYELYGVLAFVRMTPFQLVFLILSTCAFGWIAFGSMSAAMGFLPLFAGERADTVELPREDDVPLETRTALLFPIYHEDPARIAGTVQAIADELASLGHQQAFDVFILSDTRSAEAAAAEEIACVALRQRLAGTLDVFYRRRKENTARKSGNIRDWVERFGGAYDYFVILDADSVMSGRTLVRLARAMERNPRAGLIQTVPRLTGGTTLLQRLQQFAANVYGPAVAAGLASWHRDQGNYWGHNAIIRTVAFASAAGLPPLPGRPPFGGHIQSHDFVEAALLQRGGWAVHMVPTVDGSYEGSPPSLVWLIVRDRRWAQGNLQHLKIVMRAALTPMGRVHLLMGAFSYLVSMVWAASLAVGVVLALQGQQMIPSYFQDSKTLFPIWPIIDPGAALRLFLATMVVVIMPKALGLVLEIKRAWRAREPGGTVRAVAGVLTETLFSMLLAPILMVTQTVAVIQIAFGRDSDWKPQHRQEAAVPFLDALAFHWRHTAIGIGLALVCWEASTGVLAWMAPVILGLVLSGPLTWITSRQAGPVLSLLLATPEDRSPPGILVRAARYTAEWSRGLAEPDRPPTAPATNLPRAA